MDTENNPLLRALLLAASAAMDGVLERYRTEQPESAKAFWGLFNAGLAHPYVEVIVGESRMEFGFVYEGRREAILRWAIEPDRMAMN